MMLNYIEWVLGWTGGAAALGVLGLVLAGVARGLSQPPGYSLGRYVGWLRSPWFYLLATAVFLWVCIWLWRPLPLALNPELRWLALILGGPLLFGGLGLVAWGRLALGRNYFVSTGLAAQLQADHALVTDGPFAWVRHPMYLGLAAASLGGLLLYRQWALVFLALCSLALARRARVEERLLRAVYGEAWEAYCRQAGAILPRRDQLRAAWQGLRLEAQVLLQVGVLFLPGIPAYLWVWPRVSGPVQEAWQALVYGYILAGTAWIGRRYSADRLGLNGRGLWLSLLWGGALILGRTLVIRSVDWGSPPPAFEWGQALWEAFFYFALVGLTEELLFRGLLYRALLDWKGLRWAIWGSSLGFVLWHIFGQGPLIGAATLLYGLIFALLRWRAGGIAGLIVVHGLMDWLAVQMLPSINVVGLGRPEVPQPGLLLLGLVLIVGVPLGLWRLGPSAR